MSRIYAFFIGCLLTLAVAQTASASIIGLPAFELALTSSGHATETLSGSNLGLASTNNGNFTANGTHTSLSGDADYTWSLLLDPDPTIGGTFSFTNLLSTAKDYDLNFMLPVGMGFSPAVVNGHFAGAVADANGNGNAYLNNVSWLSLVDGVSVMSAGPTSFACATINCTSVQPTTYLDPLNYLPGVSTSISTNVSFTLSAGDRVTFNTYFDVAPVPEPGTLMLLAGALVIAPWIRIQSKSCLISWISSCAAFMASILASGVSPRLANAGIRVQSTCVQGWSLPIWLSRFATSTTST